MTDQSAKSKTVDTNNLRVMVLDDHTQIRKAILKVIETMNFKGAIEMSNGTEAIEFLKEEPIDLLILDLYLLDMSGFDVLDYIRNREVDSDIPVLVVTGEASKDEIVKAADLGADDYLVKPFQSDDFKNKIQKVLQKYHSPAPIVQLFRRAQRHFFNEEYDEALKIVEEALKVDPNSIGVRHLKAITLDKLGKLDKALVLLKENIQINENFYKNFSALGDICLRLGKNAEAIDAILKELELNPKQPSRQTQVANLLLDQGKVEDAINHFRTALQDNVRYRLALFGMGRAYAMQGNVEKSVYYYKRVRRYYATNTKALDAIVKTCIDAKEPRRAEATLKDEKNTNKNRLDTYLVLAKFYLSQEKKPEALTTLDELLVLKPDSIEGLRLKASIHIKHQEYPKAIEIYTKLVKLDDRPETRIQFCDLLMNCKRYLDASVVLHGCLRQKHDYQKVFSRLATCYALTDQAFKASLVFQALRRRGVVDEKLSKYAQHAEQIVAQRRAVVAQAQKRIA